MLQTLLAALLAFLAAAALGSCSDGSCSSTGSLWLQLKGARSSSQGAEEPDFFPVHGGAGRSCRGSDAHDNLASHYIANHAASLDECKEQCLAHAACKGIDFSHTGCKLWTRSIGATLASPGSTCMRLLQDISALQNFREVDGGQGKGCRGSHPGDKQESYFKSMIASDLEECKSNCVVDAECQGVSYQSRGLCEVWVRPGGIQATADETDSICLEGPGPNPTPSPSTTSPTPMPGWEKHAGLNCYKHHGAEGIDGKDPLPNRKTVPECMEECLKEQSCAGIVMPEGDGSDSAKTCWLRRNVRKSKCRAGSPYNFWARPGANIDGTDPGTETTTCCAGYDSWPNLDKDDQGNVVATCNGCTALVETGPWQGRCDKYCESFGHECFAAAEEVEDDCAVKQTFDCDKPIEGTSDMLCSCRLPQAVDEPNCDWPGQETTTTTTPAANGPCCLPFQAWPKVDGDVTCGDCMALVLTNDFGGRCDRYCESMNPPHVCVYAAEEQEENCETKKTYACNEAITGTSDMLCKCVKQNAPASCPKPAETTTPAPNNNRIKVSGRQILVDGVPLHIKGVAWNPVPKGGRHPGDLNFAQFVEQDAKLMQEMGINAVRTYEPIVDTWILDTLWRRGIWVVNSVYNWGGAAADTAADPVKKTKDHPAILMWTIGNEWNYNGLYVGSSFFDCVSKIRDVAEVVRQYDTTHPISSIYGDTGRLSEAAEALPLIEIWGINSYRGISFGNLFSQVESATDKPMYLGEYGADAYNANIQAEDQDAQAKATERLTAEIIGKTSVLGRGPCIGGFIFEFNDEWHKDNDGSPNDHDTGGIAPGGGPYPDKTFTEEWWGLVTVDREKRKAVEKYAASELPTTGAALTSMTS